jgi:uncharacterized protein
VPNISRHQNVIVLPHHSEFYHPDLVQAADLVIGKLGYSTLSEVGHAGKPFGYILREDSRESEALRAYAVRHIQGTAISEKSFASNDWLENVSELLALKVTGPSFPNDVSLAANIILDAAKKRKNFSTVHRQFDPFTDRKSRDIRNQLSENLVKALAAQDQSILHRTADSLLAGVSEDTYREYIQERIARYDRVLRRADIDNIMNSRQQATLLWNEHLFFECHELLEEAWQQVSGGERKALQGLIQAAGAYIHSARGKQAAAKKLAKKAVFNLETHQKHLFFIGNLEELIAALRNEISAPPVLVLGV